MTTNHGHEYNRTGQTRDRRARVAITLIMQAALVIPAAGGGQGGVEPNDTIGSVTIAGLAGVGSVTIGDASPREGGDLRDQAIELAQRTGTGIAFLLTGDCGGFLTDGSEVWSDNADGTGRSPTHVA